MVEPQPSRPESKGIANGLTPAPKSFFNQKGGLRHARLRDSVLAIGPIVVGPGGSLYQYRGGVYLPDGENEVRRRVSALLGNRWRRSHAEGLVADLKAQLPMIDDTQPTEWINCPNGLLDWPTGTLHPHRPDVASTCQLAVPYNPHATCHFVDQWLEQVAPDDAIDLIWEVIGICIYVDMPIHKAVLLWGPGRNGKGTLLRLITALIGQQHVSAVTLQALAENRFVAAELFGKVANIAGDLDARHLQRSDVFKMVTGGDLITAERKFGQPFTFRNRATMVFSANEPPSSADLTDGFFSRLIIVPFTKLQLTHGQEDPEVEHDLHSELDGVLVKAVAGLNRVMKNSAFTISRSVRTATDDYRQQADPVRAFVDDRLDVVAGSREKRSLIYHEYKAWCEDNGRHAFSSHRFYAGIERIDGVHQEKSGDRYLRGLSFRS
jgi:putative DNA primase/helicase